MYRWSIFKLGPLPRIYLHKFLRSDDDRALHDHPWRFVSIILRGGYIEQTETPEKRMLLQCRTSVLDWRSPFWRRCVAYRSATFRHRVILPRVKEVDVPCWTLFITGRIVREWGFWCKGERGKYFVPWAEFDGCES